MTEPKVRPRSRWIRWVKITFFVAIVIALAWFLWRVDWDSLQGVTFRIEWAAVSVVLGLAFRYLGVWVWRTVLSHLGARELPSFAILADVYAKSWLARYIPGTLPWIAGKIYLAAERGISKSKLAVSSLVEAGAQVVGVGALSLALLAIDGRIAQVAPALQILTVAGAVALLAAMAPPIFNRLLALGFRLVKRGTAVAVSWRGIGVPVGYYAVGAVVSGLSYVALTHALLPGTSVADTLFLIGAFGLAGVVGMLTPLVPSGLGTRDGAQLLLLVVILPAPEAALLVLASRVWSAVVDLAFWAWAQGARRIFERRQ